MSYLLLTQPTNLLFGAIQVNQELIMWVGGGILVVFFLFLWIVKSCIEICPPNMVMVISGRQQKQKGETQGRGYRLKFGGLVFYIPVINEVRLMSLNTIPINITVEDAYSKGNIALMVEAVANVKLSSDPQVIHNGIERFLGRELDEIKRVVQDTLEGNLREVLATLTPEEVNEDRLRFAASLKDVAEDDLSQLGLHLDTLKIQHVSDRDNYLDSIGRRQIAHVVRDAEIAESEAKREAESVSAKAKAEAEVVQANAQAEIARKSNALRELKAELEAKARAEEEKTLAAALEARALAEQELQLIRAELEKLRLQADKIIPAEANKHAKELQAKGAAAPIAENGKAVAGALQEMSNAWGDAGQNARQIFLIQQLEKILGIVVSSVKDMHIDEVHLLDNGDGQAIPNYVRSFPDTVAAILQSLSQTTGIDVPSILGNSIANLQSEEK